MSWQELTMVTPARPGDYCWAGCPALAYCEIGRCPLCQPCAEQELTVVLLKLEDEARALGFRGYLIEEEAHAHAGRSNQKQPQPVQ